VRGDHGFAARYEAPSTTGPLLVHEERRAASPSQIFLPFSSPLTQTYPISLLRTLAAAAGEFLQIPVDSGCIFRRQQP
jgi:hypothetical protein